MLYDSQEGIYNCFIVFFLLGRTVGSLGPKYSSYLYVIASIYIEDSVYI